MGTKRPRTGELLALIGAIGLLVLLFLDWFEPRRAGALSLPGHTQLPEPVAGQADARIRAAIDALAQSGWSSLGWFAAFVLALTIVVVLVWMAATLTRESPAIPVAGEVLATWLGALATIVVLARLVFQPALDLGLANDQVTALAPAYLGLVCTLLITAGAWIALKDPRTRAPSAPRPDVELRPIPPPR